MVTLGPQCVFPTTFIGIWHGGGGGFSLFTTGCLIFIQLLGLLRMLFSQQTHVCLIAGDFVGPSFSILSSLPSSWLVIRTSTLLSYWPWLSLASCGDIFGLVVGFSCIAIIKPLFPLLTPASRGAFS